MTKNEYCRLCGHPSEYPFSSSETKWGFIHLYRCPNCHYVQTQRPTWLSDAYAEPINASDTGIMMRNATNVDLVISTLSTIGILKGKVVDFAGGYGILVRMLRDKGIDAYWSDQFTPNLLSRGFEYSGDTVNLLSAFEVFEHLGIHCRSRNMLSSLLTFCFQLNWFPILFLLGQWWYYGLEHGQHIGFFNMRSLRYFKFFRS